MNSARLLQAPKKPGRRNPRAAAPIDADAMVGKHAAPGLFNVHEPPLPAPGARGAPAAQPSGSALRHSPCISHH